MAKRDDYVPEDLLEHLAKYVPGFRRESQKAQMGLARMLWESTQWKRRHLGYPSWFWFHYKELDELFGRGAFKSVNDRLQIFDVTSNWSREEGRTKAYRLTPSAQNVWTEYIEKRRRDTERLYRLLSMDGREIRTLQPAIAAKDMDGVSIKAWRRSSPRGLNAVRIDVEALDNLARWLDRKARELDRRQFEIFSTPTLDHIYYLLHYIAQIQRMARTTAAGFGYIPHRYVESASGRLYAKGVSLQTAPTVIKQAALSGLHEYDFSNCHFSILVQMAERYGYKCDAIRHYLGNKKDTRLQIAQHAGITDEEAKVCLIAILYGARLSVRESDAIPEAIGKEAAQKLYQSPLFTSLKNDVTAARRAILAKHPRTRKGWLTNLAGKSIGGRQSPEKILAHLIQGVEARALRAAIECFDGSVVLLQHDGFATTTRLDVGMIEQAVREATGYQLSLEVETIQPDPDAWFARTNLPKQSDAKSAVIADEKACFGQASAS